MRNDSKGREVNDCFKEFEILESIYGNDFGICYTFFAKNYSIYLKDNDYIQFDINYETQQKFIINGFYIPVNKSIEERRDIYETLAADQSIGLYFEDYFGLYFYVNSKSDKRLVKIENSLKSTRNSLNAELRFRKTSVELLSMPYMQKCIKYGMYSIDFIQTLNYFNQ